MNSPLSHFKLAQYEFVLEPLNPIHLPAYKGSTFRDGFAISYRTISEAPGWPCSANALQTFSVRLEG
jgi:hypothetical protein